MRIVAEAVADAEKSGGEGAGVGGPADAAPPPLARVRSNEVRLESAAASACEAVLRHIEVGQANGTLGDHVDDRSIAVLLLSGVADTATSTRSDDFSMRSLSASGRSGSHSGRWHS